MNDNQSTEGELHGRGETASRNEDEKKQCPPLQAIIHYPPMRTEPLDPMDCLGTNFIGAR